MDQQLSIPVVTYQSERIDNPNPNGDTPFEEFWEVRAALLNASQHSGETGPESSESPQYWIVEDQYNDELYQYMEVYGPSGWRVDWLLALIKALHRFAGWGICINVHEGYLLAFADRLMVSGDTFAGCHNLQSVVDAAKSATQRLHDRKYGLLNHQLQYVHERLPGAMQAADTKIFAHLATFDRYQLYDQPAVWILQTKRDDALRLVNDSSPIRTTAVTADGVIHPEYCKDFWPYTDVTPPYWLVTYLIEDTARKPLDLVDDNDRIIGSISIDDVITGADLRQHE